ncbi:hypothetical protein BTR14_03175 [Rhizobium rhizosphaerae]|uniref:DNA-binding protein n=1 Tax=Xaviernesmea rhizosphaerae TaxID=1672749 RepID=A0ABX3PH86_9HYPH|nr:hypothetical protein [Xaviernesmea rhizosphaerae]OQP87584.1 hypothetical protein BTR14_03175 [Xaviernesmea rhizosphaerae]
MTGRYEKLPYWPAALNAKMAASYCGLSVDTFKEICPVRPIQFTQSAWGQRYLRQRLDEWMLSLDPNPAPLASARGFFASSRGVAGGHSENNLAPRSQLMNEIPQPESALTAWKRKNEERQRHAPRHKLKSNYVQVLKFLANHPEGQTVGTIPLAGEKTIEHLAKLGLVQAGNRDLMGDREWHLSKEGKAEVDRIYRYETWKFTER